VGGNWSDAGKWSPAVVPNNGAPSGDDTYQASIAATGAAYTVNLDVPVSVNGLTLDSSSATVTQPGVLTLPAAGTLDVNAGLYRMVNGTITGGTINVAPTAAFRIGGGTLTDVTLAGTATVEAGTGLMLRGASQFAGATVLLNATGRACGLSFNTYPNTTMLAGTGQVIFGGNLSSSIDVQAASLDIAPGITIATAGGSGKLTTSSFNSTITNRGVISSRTVGQSITVGEGYTTNVYNSGTLSASGGGTLVVNKLTGDAGTLSLSGTGVLDLRGNFTVNQALTLMGGNSLKLSGKFEVAQPLTANSGSKIELGGTWTNTAPVTINGATVTLDSPYNYTAAAPLSVSNSVVSISAGLTTAGARTFFANHNTVSLANGAIDNTGDTLALDPTTGSISMRDSSIYGGTITASGGVKLNAVSGYNTLYNVDLGATVQVASGTTLVFGQDTDNPGVSINRAAINGSSSTVSLTGQWRNLGTINLGGGTLEIAGPATDVGSITLSNTALNLKSTVSTQQLGTIMGTSSKMVISDQGRVDLGGGTWGPTGSTGPLYLNGGTVQNGTLVAPGANKVLTSGGNWFAALDNVTLGTDLTIVPSFKLSTLRGLTLTGNRITIKNIQSQYNQGSGLYMAYGEQTLGGTGEVVFDGTGSAAVLETEGAKVTIAPGIIVRTGNGSGYVGGQDTGTPGYGSINNQGTIRADGAGRKIEFTKFNNMSNTGRLEAKNGGKLLFSGGGQFFADWTNDGTIHLESAGNVTVVGTTFTNGAEGRIEGVGTLDVTGTTFVNQGALSPGLSPGQLNVTGNLTEESHATLLIQIGGTGAADYDRLAVSGTASLGGTLDVELINGFVPSAADRFDFLTAGSVVGEFDRVVVHGGGAFDVTSDGAGGLALTSFAVPEPSGELGVGMVIWLMLGDRRGGRALKRLARA
jgi:hypothetical protein